MGGPDWELLERNTSTPAPKRDIVATDGQQITLGDTTLTIHLTPGHTAGTISTLIPVKDHGRPHVMALWGGTLFNFGPNPNNYTSYIESAARFREFAAKAGADGVLSNHTEYDGSTRKLGALALRTPNEPHPYVIGRDATSRFFTVAEQCARAALAGL
jgi:metallo-beta-lactamase class B